MTFSTGVYISDDIYVKTGIVMAVLFTLGFIENVAVLVIYRTHKKLRTKTNYWICAIIVCDLLMVLNSISYVMINGIAKRNVFGYFGCQYDGFIVTVLGTTSIFLLTGLSVHRYGIMLERHRIKGCHTTMVIKAICLCFGFGIAWGTAPLVGWGSFALEGIGISCAPNWRSRNLRDRSFTIAMYVWVLVVPLLIIGCCYSRILLKVRSKTRTTKHFTFTLTIIYIIVLYFIDGRRPV